jgi:energy-converting hydrogenase Eha subunit C
MSFLDHKFFGVLIIFLAKYLPNKFFVVFLSLRIEVDLAVFKVLHEPIGTLVLLFVGRVFLEVN